MNGNGTAHADDAVEAPRSKENIFLFVPNLIGMHYPPTENPAVIPREVTA